MLCVSGSGGFLEIDLVDLNLAVDEFIDVNDNSEAVDVHQHEAWVHVVGHAAVGPRRRTRVNYDAALVFVRCELVGVSRHQNIHVQLPLQHRQRVQVSPWNHLCFNIYANQKLESHSKNRRARGLFIITHV